MNAATVGCIQTTPCVLIVLAYLLQLGTSYASLPNRLAVHFNFAGVADSWMPRGGWAAISSGVLIFEALLFVFLIADGPAIKTVFAIPIFYAVLAIVYVAFRHILIHAAEQSGPNMRHLFVAGAAGLAFGMVLALIPRL